MLTPADERSRRIIGKFADHLNAYDASAVPVAVHVAPDKYTAVAAPDGGAGFGAYVADQAEPRIVIVSPRGFLQVLRHVEPDATEADALEEFYRTLAHEYRHHVQYVEGRKPDEDDAEAFAERVMRNWRNKCGARVDCDADS